MDYEAALPDENGSPSVQELLLMEPLPSTE